MIKYLGFKQHGITTFHYYERGDGSVYLLREVRAFKGGHLLSKWLPQAEIKVNEVPRGLEK